MKKFSAIALTATMILSLVGCSKKNFDGDYNADIDLSKIMASTIQSSLTFGEGSSQSFDGAYTAEVDIADYICDAIQSSIEDTLGSSDYEWTGTLVVPMQLELSDGEFTLSIDGQTTSDNFKTFISDNIEPYMVSVFENEISSEPSLSGMTLDEVLEAAGYSSIWETMGYESKEEFIEDYLNYFDASNFDEETSGEYETDGDTVTLKGVGADGSDGWSLTSEDDTLTGTLDLSEFDIDEDTEISFVRDDSVNMASVIQDAIASSQGSSDYEWTGTLIMPYQLELSEGEYSITVDAKTTLDNFETYINDNIESYIVSIIEKGLASNPDVEGMSLEEVLEAADYSSVWEAIGYESKEAYVEEYMANFSISDFEEKDSGEYEIDGDSITLKDVDAADKEGENWTLTYNEGNLEGSLNFSDLGVDEDADITFVREAEE
ncbi:hypothetical protein SAMN04487884_11541 [Butyrivibrio fibrisolvens]|uniref:Uncharacterized protein n=2 Tax=Butyrivibrio fibrisolvens TaxID=831 RepID=A0A1H9TK69_BUTFI|nr:hypothetical protein SAMN04487884_11541 [Butyrivibrio fibrisolvens]